MKISFGCVIFLSRILTQSASEIDDYEKLHNFMMRKMDSEDPSLRAGIGTSLNVSITLFVEDITNLNQVNAIVNLTGDCVSIWSLRLIIIRQTTSLISKELSFWVGKTIDLNLQTKRTYRIHFGKKILKKIYTPLKKETFSGYGHQMRL